MKKNTYINELEKFAGQSATLRGWVYNKREGKSLIFLILRDGTGTCQCIINQQDVSDAVWQNASELTQESSVAVTGKVIEDERSSSGYEIHVTDVNVVQIARDYPITPKEHGVEFLMENRHLWLRSQRQWAIMRIRNEIIFAIHTFFQERGFIQMDAPIFTGNAVEGTSTLFETNYFDQKAYLTQSGQLYGEAMAMAHGKIYTFGPTFRAEKSKTRRHLTEFWMIEPEMAYYDLEMNMDLAEEMMAFIVDRVLSRRETELASLNRDTTALEKARKSGYPRITYTQAIERLKSDEMRIMLDEMEDSRKQEDPQLRQEMAELEKRVRTGKKRPQASN